MCTAAPPVEVSGAGVSGAAPVFGMRLALPDDTAKFIETDPLSGTFCRQPCRK